MSEERKKHGATFWVAAAVVTAILYVASFGPACWITSRMNFGSRAIPTIYWPITLTFSIAYGDPPNVHPIGESLLMYAQIGAADSWFWQLDPEIEEASTGEINIKETLRWCPGGPLASPSPS